MKAASQKVRDWRDRTKKPCACGTLILRESTTCFSCARKATRIVEDTDTLQDVIYAHHHKSSAFAKVRARARSKGLAAGWKRCVICPYDKHIEIAHVVPISSFPLSTPMMVVNDLKNLAPLCPNCHWEYDHGMITRDALVAQLDRAASS